MSSHAVHQSEQGNQLDTDPFHGFQRRKLSQRRLLLPAWRNAIEPVQSRQERAEPL